MKRLILWAIALALLVALPPVVQAIGQPFYIDLVRRIMILAIAAVSLNLILGYGGMVSFGHAAYLGIGAYAVGVLAHHGVTSGWVQFPLAVGASALIALAIGAVSVRASGIYFIMITLAFTQMLYYLGLSIEEYGADDGMRLAARSRFAGLLDLRDATTFYYLVFAILLLFLYVAFHDDELDRLALAPSSSDVAAAEEGPASHVSRFESLPGSAVRGRPARAFPLEAQD